MSQDLYKPLTIKVSRVSDQHPVSGITMKAGRRPLLKVQHGTDGHWRGKPFSGMSVADCARMALAMRGLISYGCKITVDSSANPNGLKFRFLAPNGELILDFQDQWRAIWSWRLPALCMAIFESKGAA